MTLQRELVKGSFTPIVDVQIIQYYDALKKDIEQRLSVYMTRLKDLITLSKCTHANVVVPGPCYLKGTLKCYVFSSVSHILGHQD